MEATQSVRTPSRVSDILVTANNSSEALAGLYRYRKALNPHFSLARICRLASIPSKGYLSDVINGRRTLNLKYREPVASAFNLDEEQATCFDLLVQRDHSRDEHQKTGYDDQLVSIKRRIGIENREMPQKLKGEYFPFEVFCSFALFDNSPSLGQLLDYFGRPRRLELEKALAILVNEGLIVAENGRYTLTEKKVIFDDRSEHESRRKFLSMSLLDAERKLNRWLPERDLAHFHSTIISVRKEDYRKLLPELRAVLRKYEADLEADNADMIVRFSAQLHPLK